MNMVFLIVQKSRLQAKHTWVICLSSEIDFFEFWRTYFSFILMSATFWRMSNFPVSTLASTWDELSKLDQTLQLSCGTKFLERNQTLYCVTTTQRNFKYFRKSWNTATFSWNKKSKKSYSFSENKHCNFIGGQETQRNLKSLDEANRDKQMKP